MLRNSFDNLTIGRKNAASNGKSPRRLRENVVKQPFMVTRRYSVSDASSKLYCNLSASFFNPESAQKKHATFQVALPTIDQETLSNVR